ncbi:hypothetical protein C900_02774 [Fulvivirga imtechensis AK7]|uniref:Uncharacterized protein n=1 Tax=Fulvivirga imtechensis AK7 TaxID=1237149 RepID=L8JT87_9BACT|nr:hypothetical protein C900_02774 [Fulvivirga imtechensis AK7]
MLKSHHVIFILALIGKVSTTYPQKLSVGQVADTVICKKIPSQS